MGWKDILKIKINSLFDATRVARDYLPEDWIEGYLITQEEYDKLSVEEKIKYHRFIKSKYINLNLGHKREAKYHANNAERLLVSTETAVNKPHPTEEEDFKHKMKGRVGGWKDVRNKRNRGVTQVKRPPIDQINQMIIDYFTIYNRRFGRNPTLQDIENEEDRPLTVDEIDSFKRYAQSR